MKMYHFNPNDHGAEYFVMEENKTKAHECLIKHLENKIIKHPLIAESIKTDLDIWKQVNPSDSKSFPSKYTLDEHEVSSVIESEIA